MADLQLDLPETDPFTVGQLARFELGDRFVAVGDRGAGGLGQFEMSRKEVGVKVGFEDQLNRHVVLGG